MAYAQLEPFGAPAQFWRAGLIAATLLNVNRTKKSQKFVKPEDMMPDMMVNQPEASPEIVNEHILRTFQELADLPPGTLEP